MCDHVLLNLLNQLGGGGKDKIRGFDEHLKVFSQRN